MGKLIFTAITSLDGFVADSEGNFDWSRPDEEVHAFVNDLERPVGTYLYGRRMYETMRVWETDPSLRDNEDTDAFADVWTALPKVVFSRTLGAGTHTILVKSLGTARVDLDGFTVVR